MIGQLEINGYRVDLDSTIPFPVTYSIADIKNPEKRKRSRSKTVDLPGTQRNMDLFASAFQLTISPDNGLTTAINFDPTARTVARYYFDSILVFDGLVKLNKVVIKDGNHSFNITLYSNIVNIIKDLGKLRIKDLNWSMYNHRLTRDVVEKSWNESVNVITDGSGDPDNGSQVDNFSGNATTGFVNGPPEGWGYVYPVAEYGYDRAAMNEFKTNDLIPMFYVREVVHKIFDEQFDLEVVSEFMDTELFRRKLIGACYGDKVTITAEEIAERQITTEGAIDRIELASDPGSPINGLPNPYFQGPNNPAIYHYRSLFIQETLLKVGTYTGINVLTDDLGQLNTTTGIITVQRTGSYKLTYSAPLRLKIDVENDDEGFALFSSWPGNPSISSTRLFGVKVFRNGVEVSGVGSSMPYGTTLGEVVTQTITGEAVIAAEIGDSIQVKYFFDGRLILKASTDSYLVGPSTGDVTVTMDVTDNIDFGFEALQEELDDNDVVNLSMFAPEMKCSDFLMGVILAFNLYVDDPDLIDGSIAMEPLEDYYQEDVEAIDWTDKVDHSKKFEILPASTIEGETYSFEFKQDDDYDNERYRGLWNFGYGNREYQVPSTFVTGVRRYELPFAISVPVRLRTVPGADPSDITAIIAPRIVFGNPYVGDVQPHAGEDRLYVYNGLVVLPDDPQEYFRLTNVTDGSTGGNYEDFTAYPCINHQNSLTDPTFDLLWAPVLDYWETWNGVQTNVNLWQYHSKFVRELTLAASAIIRCHVKLMPADIYTLDFSRLIKINGVLFRLNEVKDWDPNSYQSARVELLKVIELSQLNTGTQQPVS